MLPRPADFLRVRQERLRAVLAARKIGWLLVSGLANVAYLTGFRGSAGLALFGPKEGILWVDPRYTLEAQQQAQGVEVHEERQGLLKAAGRWLSRHRVHRAGYEAAHLTCSEFELLRRETGAGVKLWPAGEPVEELRVVKDAEEIARIRDAGRLTASVFEQVLTQVRPGVKEAELAAEIEYRMRKMGAEGAAFETIVASGSRAASPHARASSKSLQENELVIFDLGAILAGYAADMTRTVHLGEPSARVRGFYEAVLDAQRQAVAACRVGAEGGEVDAAARRALGRYRLGRYFTHSTGHGVGLEIHERPRLVRGERSRLPAHCVVTAEPGIYISGVGGVRIEDTLLVGPEGPEILTPASKDHWVLT
jgi:Xaa-Pro aminopeptidase